ncbi:hypothetical protein QBC39DRAFT_370202 [Podospora conica]|nr:hypothetical protein QBC39DRAFT_370202 [Schizothecium conicum]
MPPKPTIYTTERSNRDFSWFPSRTTPQPSPPPEVIDLSPDPQPTTTTPSGPRKPRPPPTTTPRRVHKSPSIMFGISKPPRRNGPRPTTTNTTKEPPRIVLQPPTDDNPPPAASTPKPGPWSEWFPTRDSPPRFWRARKLPDETWTYQHSPTPSTAQPIQRSLVASFFFGLPVPSPPPQPSSRNPSPKRPPPPPRSLHSDSDPEAEADHLKPTPLPRSSGTTFPSSAVSTGKGKGSSLMSNGAGTSAEGGKLEVEGEVPGGSGKGRQAGGGKGRQAMALVWMAGGAAPRQRQGGEKGGAVSNNAKRLASKVRSEKEMRVDSKTRVRTWLRDVAACERPGMAEWDGEGLPIY